MAFNKEKALVGAFTRHFETSRRFADSSSLDAEDEVDEVEEEVAVPGEVLQSLRRALHPAADWRGAAGAGPALAPAAAAG